MLQLRIITPPDRTDEVVALLETTVGVAHVMVLAGAAREPAGDVVVGDVAREAADELLEELRELGLDSTGAITVQGLDLSLSVRSDRAEDAAPGEGVDAVLWESLRDATDDESRLSFTYLAFLAVATMLAACGVMLDSAILIVGAMVVGPEFGPLAGLCTGLLLRTGRAAWRSLLALLVGFPAAMLVTCGFALLMDAFGLFSREMFDQPHPASEFVWQPDMMSLVVAMLAGVVGILSLTSAKAGALVGVAISVTTVPAAGHAALALSYGQYHDAQGSMIQLGVNLVGILLAGTLTLLAQKLLWARVRNAQRASALRDLDLKRAGR
ncbi:DUF389 domain-containing protein [Streptomyces litchfieldiae]|uniref:DUF389 domain-containing protein n=1 Tax=Streptomyces litchfieldiae TaxID=3075543 RepID=A0ABU2MXS2_9ACTN|nr:DUF389 domain-containing protein [Streptomyces sp. DSM 44938]MDT0346462.1 DUF389 domain-containing protein [Streptomyces sp. DSM 44938]